MLFKLNARVYSFVWIRNQWSKISGFETNIKWNNNDGFASKFEINMLQINVCKWEISASSPHTCTSTQGSPHEVDAHRISNSFLATLPWCIWFQCPKDNFAFNQIGENDGELAWWHGDCVKYHCSCPCMVDHRHANGVNCENRSRCYAPNSIKSKLIRAEEEHRAIESLI